MTSLRPDWLEWLFDSSWTVTSILDLCAIREAVGGCGEFGNLFSAESSVAECYSEIASHLALLCSYTPPRIFVAVGIQPIPLQDSSPRVAIESTRVTEGVEWGLNARCQTASRLGALSSSLDYREADSWHTPRATTQSLGLTLR